MKRLIFEADHEQLRESARTFVDREVLPYADQWEADGIIDREVFKKAGEAGLVGFYIPEEYGGSGIDDFRFNAVVIESPLIALVGALLSFAVPLAIPLFAQRWRTFAIILALAAAFFGWLTWDLQRASPGGNWIGPFLGGLMLFGFGAGAVAKFVMLLGKAQEPREE